MYVESEHFICSVSLKGSVISGIWNSELYFQKISFFFCLFIYFERDREREQVGGGQREREKES